jgi:gas vesicle protein
MDECIEKKESKHSEKIASVGQVAALFMGGVLAGAITALLLSPRTGRDNRRKIAYSFQKGRERLAQLPHALSQAYNEAASAAQHAFRESYQELTSTTPHAENIMQ